MPRCQARRRGFGDVGANLLLLTLLSGPAAIAGEATMVDGILHIRNPAAPPAGKQRLMLEEIWRIDEDSQLLIGLPTRVAVDAERRVHVLDAQLNQVHVFSLEGDHLATLSREGDGPGEMRNPADMLVEDNGNVGIVQEYPGKVVRFDRRGDPLPILYPGGPPEEGGWCLLMSGRARGDQLVICGSMERRDAQGQSVKRLFMSGFDRDGRERANYIEEFAPRRSRGGPARETDELRPFFMAWDIGPDGRVFVATEWAAYKISVFRPDGTPDRIIERDFQPWHRTAAEKRRILALFGVTEEVTPPPIELAEIAPTIALYQGGIQVMDNGELWIHSSRGNRALPEGVLATFDVYDEDGHFRRQVEVYCPGDPWNDRLLFVPGDRVIRVRRFVDALATSMGPGGLPEDAGQGDGATPAVICYKVRS